MTEEVNQSFVLESLVLLVHRAGQQGRTDWECSPAVKSLGRQGESLGRGAYGEVPRPQNGA